ncbi:MAG TPA: ABC transporter permease [Tepidisphaeraceae bacterium]|nr:ABC transporter permease [Tepidisphaeraceae bacterium]
MLLRPITAIGAFVLGVLEFLGGLAYLIRDTFVASRQGLFSRRAWRFAWKHLWFQADRVGVKSIPIVSLVMMCIGAILALQMAPILRDFGQVQLVANIISIAVFRELGPLVSAVVLTGFAGASIAAEIGSMVVSEEIEALEAEAIDPIRFLVVPRVFATTIMMVCIAVVGDLMGIIGGLLTSHFFLGLNYHQYLSRTFEQVKIKDFHTGLWKAAVFGVLISSFACFLGLRVTGGATGVGVATTRTVVLTIVALIFVDLMFTAAFYYLGL